MRGLCGLLAVAICASVIGCGGKKSPEESLPAVTLVERNRLDGSILLRFRLTHLDRISWKGKVLRAQLVKAGERPGPGGPMVAEPGPEFEIETGVGKVTESDGVFFVPRWGQSRNGLITNSQRIELAGSEGEVNRLSVTGTQGRTITQILETCTGPGQTMPWDPWRGVDLLKVGYRPESWTLRVWVAPAPKPQ